MTTPAARLFAALAFCVSSVGLLSTARANYYLFIDCHGNNGLPTWAQTSDKVKLEVWFQDVLTDSFTFDGLSYCDVENGHVFAGKPYAYAAGITKIRFTTSGTNAFWLDKLLLSTSYTMPGGDGALFWGIDNNVGWCFSREAADGNSSYCLGATAYTSGSFVR